jgi:hypothetical protein
MMEKRMQNAVFVTALAVFGGSVAEGAMKCPHAVSFDPLPVARAQAIETAWSNPVPFQAELKLPGFFGKGDALTVRCASPSVGGECVRSLDLVRGSSAIATFPELSYFGLLFGRQAVYLADYDGNGRKDIKFVVPTGGCAGNSNNGKVYYLFQHEREWWLVSYFIRDLSYAWECDLNGDGRFELVKGHHQDKRKPGYHDRNTDRWVGQVFRKYLFINAYELGPEGLTLRNNLSDRFPLIIPFTSDPFAVTNDTAFLSYNQFKLPHDYCFKKALLRRR